MKNVTQLVPAAARALRTTGQVAVASQPLGVVDDQTGEVVEKIFRQLQGIFPAYKQAWPDDRALNTARRNWTAALVDAGISSIEQVRYAILQCRRSGSPFAPSVGQFIAWCKPTPEQLGLPEAEDAWMQALMAKYSHEAVRLAAIETGLFDLRAARQDDKSLRSRFDRAYEIIVRRAQEGEPLDARIATGIGHDSQKGAAQLADEYAHQRQARLLDLQQIPSSAAACRAHLLAKLNIKRAGQPAGEGV
ncbi:Replication protein P [Pseudomonas fulva]|uniref:replication protein P n=1 Tax=Pseudomonas fulva TaxID=47880 RepID=UPI0018AA578B|nr:replication protein P [Pseudomonas fulva]MBF8674840.1 Replication protein P [Pseudomonas fulva]MBF8696601.1 Replication protein P [Pseudomonas fulva]